MSYPRKTYFPVIHTASLPTWMKWRDALLTLMMWILFGILLWRQFTLVKGSFHDATNLAEFFALLAPYGAFAVMLIVFLLIAAVFTTRRRQRGFMLSPPKPLLLADEARRAGLDESSLAAARSLRISVVHIDDAGRLRVEPRLTDD